MKFLDFYRSVQMDITDIRRSTGISPNPSIPAPRDPHRGLFSRATSESGTVDFSPVRHTYLPFTQHSRNSSPISVLSHELVSSHSPLV